MPGAVPNIFAGFRIAVPYAIAAAVIAELISSNRGLGYLVQTGAMNFDTTSVFAAIVPATLLVLRRQLADERARSDAAALAPADRTRSMEILTVADALLEVRKLGKRFAQRQGREPSPWVIQDLSFSVRAGEFLTIVGPSGAGKSTLLNIIAQIDTASAGEIVFDGTDCHQPRSARAQARLRPPHRLRHAGRQPPALAQRRSTTCCSRSKCRAASTTRPARAPKR